MRHSLTAVSCAVALSAVLTACGGSSDDASPTAEQTPPVATGSNSASGSAGTGGTATSKPDANGVGLNGATKGSGAGSSSVSPGRNKINGRAPVHLSMPSVGFNRELTSLGVTSKGEINPPAGVTQWYNKTVRPGETGISVIAGHVMYDGPDVFYKLRDVSVGDVVTVTFADKTSKKFKVYAEDAVNKKDLQTDQRVWGGSDKPVLALITCDSASQVVGNHHVDNYVVWAAPV